MEERRRRRMVAALAVTQTVGYGSLYYSFAVFLAPVAAELHAGRTAVTGAFTGAVLVQAACSVPVGRWLDRHGARGLMTAGSVAGTGLLVAFSRTTSLPGLYLVWGALGAVGAAVFYESAFATVIAWSPAPRRASSILAITVVAGFASSIFLPLTGVLVDRYGWRTAALVLAAVHGAVTIPLHAIAVRRPPRPGPSDRAEAEAEAAVAAAGSHKEPAVPGTAARQEAARREAARRDAARRARQDPRFWLLGLAFTAQAAAIAAMTLHLIGLLVSAGHRATTAAAVAGSLGVLSVTGRVLVTGLGRRYPLGSVVAVAFGLEALAAAALPFAAGNLVAATTAVVGFGLGFGLSYIARPALLLQMFGATGYATLAGMLALPSTLALAVSPLATARLQQAGNSYSPVMATIAACSALAAVALATATAGRRDRPAASVAVTAE